MKSVCSCAEVNRCGRVGCVISENPIVVPCERSGSRGVQNFSFEVLDVPGDGNCLYYAVWQSAKQQGNVCPFGLSGVYPVSILRSMVADQVVTLLQEAKLICDYENHDVVKDLIAQPGQFAQFSGLIPIMGMAYMLRRTIVVLSCDGIHNVSPHDFTSFIGENENHDPILIYHCQFGNTNKRVNFGFRNHYAAIRYDSNLFSESIRSLICNFRAGRILRENSTSGNIIHLQVKDDNTKLTEDNILDVEDTILENAAIKIVACDIEEQQQRKRRRTVNGATPIIQHDRSCDAALLSSLSQRATTVVTLTTDELRALSQNYTKCPRLALLYFHCCSNDPDAFVFNNERLLDAGSDATINRLKRVLDEPISPSVIRDCHKKVRENSSKNTELMACASCCEILRGVDQNHVVLSLTDLPASFKLSNEELNKLSIYPDVIVESHIQVLKHNNIFFHLNPELVPDTNFISLCVPCSKNPREVRFSIASGHDYGRPGNLPDLNDIASNCISPVRCYGMEFALNGKHMVGHSICFLSDGPNKCSNVLPIVNMDSIPRVTFIGPAEQWRIKKKQYKRLYSIPTDDIYSWLRVLQHTHSVFRDNKITVDDSSSTMESLQKMEQCIEDNIIFQDSDHIKHTADNTYSERYGLDFHATSDDDVITTKAAILKHPSGSTTSTGIIETLLEMMADKTIPDVNKDMVVPIQRNDNPVVEWIENGMMISCAFPRLFMLGNAMLPNGSWSTELIRHLLNYYDGRFEKCTALIALLFNQLQRHTVIRNAAKLSSTHPEVIKRFGAMVNTNEFRNRLKIAKDNPSSDWVRKLNASLLRILSLVGDCIPFSPYESATSRPKIAALRYRYSVPLHFATVAPPEHDDLSLQRTVIIRDLKSWNQLDTYGAKGCMFNELPDELQKSARLRLDISNNNPALSVRVFIERLRLMFEDVIQCKNSSNTRISRHYGIRPCGAYGKVAAHFTIVEAQKDGRLHSHSLLYGSTYTPVLLTRIACSQELRKIAADWINSVCLTGVRPIVHEWYQDFIEKKEKLPRAFEIDLPEVDKSTDAFMIAAEKRIISTNVHCHSATCKKGSRGKYMCRLARPAGVYDPPTQPIFLIQDSPGDYKSGIRPEFTVYTVTGSICKMIDRGYDIHKKQMFPPSSGLLIWELQRSDNNKYIVETNPILAALCEAHTNSALICGEDIGDIVEEYQQMYMTKNNTSLISTIAVLLSAIEYVIAHPSKADDRDDKIRKGKYLASRTINAFIGAQEWPISIMIYSLLGNRSFMSSDTFWFPHALVKFLNRNESNKTDDTEESNIESIDTELDNLVAMINNDNHTVHSRATGNQNKGTRSYRVGDKLIFVSQVESYLNRGPHFIDLSPMEFEVIVDVLPIRNTIINRKRGRSARSGFPFSQSHPLYGYYEGYIRAKAHTPIFGGAPPPAWKESPDDANQNYMAQYLLSTFTEWNGDHIKYKFNTEGLFDLCKRWDHSESSIVNRQRYRYIRNILKRGHRSSSIESTITNWRNRNVDFWKGLSQQFPRDNHVHHSSDDNELNGKLDPDEDIYKLLDTIMSMDPEQRNENSAIRSALTDIIDQVDSTNNNSTYNSSSEQHGIFEYDDKIDLQEIANSIQVSSLENKIVIDTSNTSNNNVYDPLAEKRIPPINTSDLSSCQEEIVKDLIGAVDEVIPRQTLTMLHGGRGTGKSFVVRRICEEIHKRGYKTINTCPTGAGACQLLNGLTFRRFLHNTPYMLHRIRT